MASIPQQDIPEREYAQGRSLMGLFTDLWRETQTLVHQEAQLAKAELSEKVSQVTTGAGEIAAGGAVLFAGFIVLLFAAVGALQLLIPSDHAIWIAPLVVGVVVMIAVAAASSCRPTAWCPSAPCNPCSAMQDLQRSTSNEDQRRKRQQASR